MKNMTLSTNTKNCLYGLLAVMVLSFMPTGNVQAQNGEQVAEYIQQTRELLEVVAVLVIESDSERARRVFGQARQSHEQSIALLENGRPVMALTVSQRAREGARQAQRLARAAVSFEERARRYIERLTNLHDNVKERAIDSGNQRALRFVTEAEQLFRRARQQFQQTHYEVAFNLLQSAETQLKRAARILFEDGGAERLERELERTAQLINRAENNMPENADEALIGLLQKSKESLQKARTAYENDEPLKAMRLLKNAQNQVRRVLRQVGGTPSTENVTRQIERFDQRLSELEIDSSNELVEKAIKTRNEASSALKDDKVDVALRKIRTALNLLTRAGDNSR